MKTGVSVSFFGATRKTRYSFTLAAALFALLLTALTACATPPPGEQPNRSPLATALAQATPDYAELSRTELAAVLDLPIESITLVSVTGPAAPGDMTVIVLQADGRTYTYHGRDGQVLRVSEPLPTAPAANDSQPEADIVRELEGLGLTVTVPDEPEPAADMFTVPGQEFAVDNQKIIFYVYESPAAAAADAARVSESGYGIAPRPGVEAQGPTILDWSATPHFFLRDNLITLYLGDDSEVLSLLTSFAGMPFAGPA